MSSAHLVDRGAVMLNCVAIVESLYKPSWNSDQLVEYIQKEYKWAHSLAFFHNDENKEQFIKDNAISWLESTETSKSNGGDGVKRVFFASKTLLLFESDEARTVWLIRQ